MRVRPLPAALGLLGAVAAFAMGGCPLPQPLPEAVTVDGGTVTPPRILTTSVQPSDTLVMVKPFADCDGGAQFHVSASLVDDTIDEPVEARWFLDYDPDVTPNRNAMQPTPIPPVTDTSVDPRIRPIPEFVYQPGQDDPPGKTHVLEVVISNGFYAISTTGVTDRTPQPGYEAQVYRWVFQTNANGRCQ